MPEDQKKSSWKERYLSHENGGCPVCGSSLIEEDLPEYSTETRYSELTVLIYCHDCDSTWQETFVKSDVRLVFYPDDGTEGFLHVVCDKEAVC